MRMMMKMMMRIRCKTFLGCRVVAEVEEDMVEQQQQIITTTII